MSTDVSCRECGFIGPLDSAGYCMFCAPIDIPRGGFTLRPYQQQAVDKIFECLLTNRSTLLVLPTGTGKTVVFAEVIRKWPEGRVIVMAHRDELIRQACQKISKLTGEDCDVEKGEERADRSNQWNRKRIIVTSTQTMSRKNRMQRFNPHEFGLFVYDEAHHAPSPSALAVLEYFQQNPSLKLLGVTATPKRSDELAMGRVFQTVAYDYPLTQAIDDGYLVPITTQLVQVVGLDLSRVKTTAGDLNAKQLAAIMEEERVCHEVASATLQCAQGRTLVFTVSVRQAEMVAEIMNRHRPGCAEWICGDQVKCPTEVRRQTLKRFAENDVQFVVNVGVLTEGFDDPGVQTIANARPTKSHALFQQICGRGTRPLAGIIDGLPTDTARKSAIAASPKPSMVLLDFVGQAGRHKLIHAGDLLGGDFEEEIVAKATEAARQAGTRGERLDMLKALRQAEEEAKEKERKRREKVIADAKVRLKSIDPFDVWDIRAHREPAWHKGRMPTAKMLAVLHNAKIPTDNLSFVKACQIIDELAERRKKGLCTFKQALTLRKHGFTNAAEMTFTDASALLDKIAKSGWTMRGPGV